jgi:hypothetical protein
MALEVVSLWAWDPDVPSNYPITTIDVRRSPMPLPIYDSSRDNTTYANMRPLPSTTPAVRAASGSALGTGCVAQGQFVIGTSIHVCLHHIALATVPPDLEVMRETEKMCCTALNSTATSSLHDSISYLSGSMDSEVTRSDTDHNSDDDMLDIEASVAAWLEDIDKEALEPLPIDVNDTAPFARGSIGGMTVNDILMVKGLINPSVYVQFYELSLYT